MKINHKAIAQFYKEYRIQRDKFTNGETCWVDYFDTKMALEEKLIKAVPEVKLVKDFWRIVQALQPQETLISEIERSVKAEEQKQKEKEKNEEQNRLLGLVANRSRRVIKRRRGR